MAKMKIRRAQWKSWKHQFNILAAFGKKADKFEACVLTKGRKGSSFQLHACSTASNPRTALASAMSSAAKTIRRRRGAFAGVR